MKTLVKMNFNPEVAKDVGEGAAIMLENIIYWIDKNVANQAKKENKQSFRDGDWWTYNSIDAFQSQFCWMTLDQIRTRLNKLKEKGYIKTGNYNKVKYDRTTWYALGNNPFGENTKCIWENSQMEVGNIPNRFGESPKPIPNDKTNGSRGAELPPTTFFGEVGEDKRFKRLPVIDQMEVLKLTMGIHERVDFDSMLERIKKSSGRKDILQTAYQWFYRDCLEGKLATNYYLEGFRDDLPKNFEEAEYRMDRQLFLPQYTVELINQEVVHTPGIQKTNSARLDELKEKLLKLESVETKSHEL